jgi:phosphatidylserine/phosphatidylglycerophosphate/cardiolipin synthase-like enzyme
MTKVSFGFHPYHRNDPLNFYSPILDKVSTVALISFAILTGLTLASAIPLIIFKISLVSTLTYFAFYVIAKLKYHVNVCENAGILTNIKIARQSLVSCRIEAFENGEITAQHRKILIENAQRNIVISGNYCGGSVFRELLDQISLKLNNIPSLKVVILGSPTFISKQTRQLLKSLSEIYSSRFLFVETESFWHLSPGLKHISNHVKALSIDNGIECIIGGSSIENAYSTSALTPKKNSGDPSFLNYLLPDQMRDMDFHIRSSSELHRELLLLAYRWKKLNDYDYENEEKGIIWELLQESPIRLTGNPNAEIELFSYGPESDEPVFETELLKHFDKAANSIHIGHLYFHPTDKLEKALARAVTRGVKVVVITCGVFPGCPKSHYFFASRSKYNLNSLLNRVSQVYWKNISVFEFQNERTTYHKKVIVIDDTVIGGSSNFGYKSLVTNSDHEMFFVAKSRDLSRKTKDILEIDKAHSKVVSFPIQLSCDEYLRTLFNRILAPLFG